MKKRAWSVLFYSIGSTRGAKHAFLTKPVLAAAVLIAVLGMLGLGRCIYFVSSYGLAKLKMYFSLKENVQLKNEVNFFARYSREKGTALERLVYFENRTRHKFGLDSVSDDLRKAGVGGRPDNSEIALAALDDPVLLKADTVKENIFTLLRQARLEDTTFGSMTSQVNRRFIQWSQRPAVAPVGGRITSGFGYRVHPFTGDNVFHEGIDISNQIGTPVRSTADGTVSFVGYKDYFGNMIEISHPSSEFTTVFGHLEKAVVIAGQQVKRGDIIGYVGNTGRSTGPHLHYEVHDKTALMNPVDFILPPDTMID
jgi:murein DD-endopeptidase MepM/ murein hydrolase activator NlpD